MSLLGIDVGTSGCKSAVFSESGKQLSLAYSEYDYHHPYSGWAELDTETVWTQVKHTIRKAVTDAGRDAVRGLCVSSMGEAVVPVTTNRKIIGPSLLNFDIRGDEYLPDLASKMTTERLYQINGNTLGSPYSLTKLMWLKHHQPDLHQAADSFLHWGAFVSFMLGAELCVDYSLANRTLLFDLERRDWSNELLEWAGLDRDKFPATVPSGKVIGTVSHGIAEELGLPRDTLIISGGHDQCCNAVGCGVIKPGVAMYGMGSFLCAVPIFSERPNPQVMIEQGLNTEHHAASGQYVSFIYNQGGVLVKWFRDTYAHAEALQALKNGNSIYPALFSEIPEEPSNLFILPHFTTTGPPKFINDSRGVIAGLKLETTRGEILKGILEGATFYLRECFESLPRAGIAIQECTAAGGGSQSEAWVQLSADILGIPFIRLQVHEAGALGAAILAGTGSGQFATLNEGVEAMIHPKDRFDPNPIKQQWYQNLYEKYRVLAPFLEKAMREFI